MKVRFAGNMPYQATEGAAAFDLGAELPEKQHIKIWPGSRHLIPTGTYIEIPDGYVGLLCSRSGLAHQAGAYVLNAPGVIDSDFRGEIMVNLQATQKSVRIEHGDRIAQLLILPVPGIELEQTTREDFSSTLRGAAGHGSTGR